VIESVGRWASAGDVVEPEGDVVALAMRLLLCTRSTLAR
jgi:hypothetical protein